MAMKTHWKGPLAGLAVLLAIVAMPAVALAGGNWGGGGQNCGCKPPQHHRPPSNVNVNNNNNYNDVNVNVNVQSNAVAVARANAQANAVATAQSNAAAFANNMAFGSGAAVGGGSGMAAGYAGPGAVSVVNLGSGGGGEESYQATRSRFEKVVVQAFCFDDKDVPHPASQVTPDRDISNAYEGEVYRCIAGTHMQVTIAPWAEHVSFAGGKTLACRKGEALFHEPGPEGGVLECRPQIPERDCFERSLLRRFGAGIKVLTIKMTETYTAYRQESHVGGGALSLDGGVGGVVF